MLNRATVFLDFGSNTYFQLVDGWSDVIWHERSHIFNSLLLRCSLVFVHQLFKYLYPSLPFRYPVRFRIKGNWITRQKTTNELPHRVKSNIITQAYSLCSTMNCSCITSVWPPGGGGQGSGNGRQFNNVARLVLWAKRWPAERLEYLKRSHYGE
jgi:hypothetical protein